MEKRNIYMLKFLLLILIISSIVIGCRIDGDITKEKNNEEEISLNVEGKDYDILNRSEDISNIVVDIYGIDNATSIIFNDMVVIAVEMARDSKLTDDVEEMIIEVVLENDTAVRQVFITDSKKNFEQIEKIIEGLMDGQSYDSYVKEINRMIEKLKK